MTQPASVWWDVAMLAGAFLCGVVLVKRAQEWWAKNVARPARAPGGAARAVYGVPAKRPATQLPVRGFAELVAEIDAEALVRGIERKTKLSPGNWQRDCQPVLEAFAEFVQMLPASESHHHAQPGGLLQHALEVAEAALAFRAGMEIPLGVGTEERKRDEHRWTVAILFGALLHDVGKPVTDTRVMLFQEDPRSGTLWQPLAGSMRQFSAHWYSVGFADATERDYKAHAKLASLLMQTMVPQRTKRWLSEGQSVLSELMDYLSGESPDGVIGEIIKRADSDSVRRNLAHGPRTRFASARVRPLIERLMEAMRRMLAEGAQLPLNRPGAAGWVYDGSAWFVCARLADEVREYLGTHESSAGIPGKDKNDRLFDTWQEHGAALPAPDGGAVWRVRVRCDDWAPPDPFTVLRFPLDKLFDDPAQYPRDLKGAVLPVGAAPAAQVASAPAAATPTPPRATEDAQRAGAGAPGLPSVRIEPHFGSLPAPDAPGTDAMDKQGHRSPTVQQPPIGGSAMFASAAPAALKAPPAATAPPASATTGGSTPVEALPLSLAAAGALPLPSAAPAAVLEVVPATPKAPATGSPLTLAGRRDGFSDLVDDDVLAPHETADLGEGSALPTATPVLTLTAPLRPKERRDGHPLPAKMPSPAAQAFLGWVAQSVGSGELRYNEDGAMVHFVPEGALLLSPEIFKRFLEVHRLVADGPIAELRTAHAENAYKRLQNELAKSGLTLRNGDENLHYFQFRKADGSMSRMASFYLLRQPELLWNPVPKVNDRIHRAAKPGSGIKSLKLPGTPKPAGNGHAAQASPGA